MKRSIVRPELFRRGQQAADESSSLTRYRDDPVAYAHEVLGVEYIWDRQAEIARALLKPPYKILVKSGHKVGKTFLSAWLINWWFDCFDPSAVISTAPTWEALCDTVWTEVRIQRMRAGLPDHFIGASAPVMRTNDEHFAKGLSTNRSEAFHGRHRERMLFVFDEATAIERPFWTVVKTMFKPQPGYGWICFFNPVTTDSYVYQECVTEESGWRVFDLSSMEHPNIKAQLAGLPPPVPNAVTLGMVDGWVREWCRRLRDGEPPLSTDLEWRPGSGVWYRPEADFEARCLGKWPTQGVGSVWSDYLLSLIFEKFLPVPLFALPQIGCDVARQGDDHTAIHLRWGVSSLHHEAAKGWKTTETTGRLIELAREYAEMVNGMRRQDGSGRPMCKAEEIPIKVDDDGVGGGVTDRLVEQGYNAIPVRAGSRPMSMARYPNKRSELWFRTVKLAEAGEVNMGALPAEIKTRIRRQFMAPVWKLDSSGRREVEAKDRTKERIGRSPDDADAVNLAYYDSGFDVPESLNVPHERPRPGSAGRKRLFGR